MDKKQAVKHDDPDQSKRFIDKAKEIEADETEEGADKAFKKATRQRYKTQSQRS